MLRRLLILLLLNCGESSFLQADPLRNHADQQFLRQLTERGFFEIAEQHCRQMLNDSVTPWQSVRWQIRLSETYHKHAWSTAGSGRVELLNQSVEELTEYLNTQGPPPGQNLEIRLLITQAMTQSVRMALTVAEAGHLFNQSQPKTSPLVLIDSQSHQKTIDRAVTMVDGLLQHLDQIRADLDADHVRDIRDLGRFVRAELKCLRWRISSQESDTQLSDVKDALIQCQRTARDSQLKTRASWLLAELALYGDSSDAFDLQIRPLFNTHTDNPFGLPEFLTIRRHLYQQDASAALKLIRSTTPYTDLHRQQLAWLKLEALVGVSSLARQLNDGQLLETVSAEFRQQQKQINIVCRGLFADASRQTIRRFELIDEVGPEIADLIEQIQQSRKAGRTDEALRRIAATLQRLPTEGADRARGSLRLRAGEILIEQKNWKAADDELVQAVERLQAAQMPPEEAAADLLMVFAMAQRIGADEAPVTRAEYVAALESHIARYAKESTAERASEWLRKMVAADDPLRAAELALTAARQGSPDRRAAALQEFAEALNRIPFREHHRLKSSYSDVLEEIRNDASGLSQVDLFIAEMTSLRFDLLDAKAGREAWDGFRDRLDKLMAEMPEDAADQVQLTLLLTSAVVTARTSLNGVELHALQTKLREVAADDRWAAIRFLDAHCLDSVSQQGDTWLAMMTEMIIQQMRNQNLTDDDVARLIPFAANAFRRTRKPNTLHTLLKFAATQDLSESQMNAIASAIAGIEPTQELLDVQKTFWKQMIAARPQGSEAWLEGSLQFARALASGGDRQKAIRQLGRVETIYPDWGTPERKLRADALLKQFSEPP